MEQVLNDIAQFSRYVLIFKIGTRQWSVIQGQSRVWFKVSRPLFTVVYSCFLKNLSRVSS